MFYRNFKLTDNFVILHIDRFTIVHHVTCECCFKYRSVYCKIISFYWAVFFWNFTWKQNHEL